MSLFDSTMSMFESIVAKNDHSLCICWSLATPSGCLSRKACTAEPKPNQPGSMRRHCAQENTQGIARRSSMAVVFLREAGRDPMLRLAISVMTVDDQK